MIDIESIIRNEINVPVSDDLSLYKSIETKKLYTPKIRKIVNDNVPKLDYAVNSKILKEINETGYSVVDNFLSENEVIIFILPTELIIQNQNFTTMT